MDGTPTADARISPRLSVGRTVGFLAAIGLGVWVPLRLVGRGAGPGWALAVDGLAALGWVLRAREAGRAQGDQDRPRPNRLEAFGMLPWGLLSELVLAAGAPAGVAGLLVAGKLFALVRLREMRDFSDSFDGLHPVIARLIPLGLCLPLVVHGVACGWIALGSGSAGPLPDDPGFEYLRAAYWAVTTLATVGYGDVVAQTGAQMLFASGTMILGVGFFGFVLSNVASLLARLDAARGQHLASLDQTEGFMRSQGVPAGLRLQVRAYYNYLWEIRHGVDPHEVLAHLPANLRAEILFFLDQGMVRKVGVLRDADPVFLKDLVLKLETELCAPGQRIFRHGDHGDRLYFVHRGQVEIQDAAGRSLVTLGDGSHFGELALIRDVPRSAGAVARSYCELFVLRREAYLEVVARYPEFKAALERAFAA